MGKYVQGVPCADTMWDEFGKIFLDEMPTYRGIRQKMQPVNVTGIKRPGKGEGPWWSMRQSPEALEAQIICCGT